MSLVAIVPNDLATSLNTSGDTAAPKQEELLRLPHPRTGYPSLFIAKSNSQNEDALFEVQTVAPHSKRSWFLPSGDTIADGKLQLLTPIDPLFLLIPIFLALIPADGTIENFRPLDDIIEDAASRLHVEHPSIKIENVTRLTNLSSVRKAATRLCESKDITDELTVYRFSRLKLVETLSKKALFLSQSKALEVSQSLQRKLAKDQLLDLGQEKLRQSGKIQMACEFVAQYTPPSLVKELFDSYDFGALDAHVQALNDQATSIINSKKSDMIPKENINEKKRKGNSQPSRGVSKLMKVNTNDHSFPQTTIIYHSFYYALYFMSNMRSFFAVVAFAFAFAVAFVGCAPLEPAPETVGALQRKSSLLSLLSDDKDFKSREDDLEKRQFPPAFAAVPAILTTETVTGPITYVANVMTLPTTSTAPPKSTATVTTQNYTTTALTTETTTLTANGILATWIQYVNSTNIISSTAIQNVTATHNVTATTTSTSTTFTPTTVATSTLIITTTAAPPTSEGDRRPPPLMGLY
ncbi:hypothetical protein M422DRAFT_777566 [Sphaerobolus stellatus SS14]|nr:hypothetical protein M422DRAFT_777566 [Sphaerobolus stellatus SS14]